MPLIKGKTQDSWFILHMVVPLLRAMLGVLPRQETTSPLLPRGVMLPFRKR